MLEAGNVRDRQPSKPSTAAACFPEVEIASARPSCVATPSLPAATIVSGSTNSSIEALVRSFGGI